VSNPTLTPSQSAPRIPIEPAAGESWPSRVLSWMYPNRGWAGPSEAAQEPAANRESRILRAAAPATGAAARKPAGFSAGEMS